MVSGPLPLAIWRSTFRTGDGFLVGEGDFFLALVGEQRLSTAPHSARSLGGTHPVPVVYM